MFQFKIVKEVNKCLRTIDEGGVILHPTDTVYGLAGDSANNKVSIKINQIKKRKVDKPLIHLMSGIEMISDYVNNISETAFKFLKKNEPTTVIFTNINENKSKLNSIAIRIPSNEFCLTLIKELKRPLFSSSANLHGLEIANSLKSIDLSIKKNVDYIVKTKKIFKNKPSSIIKMINDNDFKVLR